MAETALDPATTTFQKEKTFSTYNQEQGKAYIEARRNYSPNVYQTIIDHHKSTGGKFDVLLDVGCGPGLATRSLAPHFTHAIGLDPSDGMLATARSLGGATSGSEPIRYEVSTAEELGVNLSAPIADGSVDLITAANAAHWFDMSGFWPAAARVLKPGGSVAMWTSGAIQVDPSMPGAAEIDAAMLRFRDVDLLPHVLPGNELARYRYVGLPLPWTLEKPVAEFDESTFFRKDWDGSEPFYTGVPEADLDTFEKMMSTGSPPTRWREAHPDLVGTDRDILKMLRKEIEQILHKAGVEKGKEKIRGISHGVVLIVKKKA